MKVQTITIIGLKKIGASIGLAIKAAAPKLTVIGHDRDKLVRKAAEEIGAIDKAESHLISAVAAGDIIILTESLTESQETWKHIARDIAEHAVVVDFGPLKKPVQKWADKYAPGKHYVGMMPIVSAPHLFDRSEETTSATADLFKGSTFCLMPSPTVDESAVETAQSIGLLLGATPFFMDIEEYDIYMQALETLPALLSAAYFRTLSSQTGWSDMRRVAGPSFAIATSLLAQEKEIGHLAFSNKQATLHWIDTMTEGLAEIRQWVANGDKETLAAFTTELDIQREEWLHERSENEWSGSKGAEIKRRGFGEQLFGSWLGSQGN